jgi:hypothetical protein
MVVRSSWFYDEIEELSDEGRAGGVEERSGKIVAPSVCPPREMQERHVGIQSITHGGDVVAKTGKATEQLM